MTQRIEKPWGFEELITLNERYSFKLLFIKAGHRTSLQYHEVKHETLYLVSGKASLEVHAEDGSIEHRSMAPGDFVELLPATVHRTSAEEDATFVEASTPENADIVRLADDYGRVT